MEFINKIRKEVKSGGIEVSRIKVLIKSLNQVFKSSATYAKW